MANQYPTQVVADDSIQSLREQILANAVVMFPRVVQDDPSYRNGHSAKDSDIFEVIISRESGRGGFFHLRYHWQAILVYGDPLRRKTAAKGKLRGDGREALMSLLATLADTVGQYFKEISMEDPAHLGSDAVVDLALMR